MQGAEVSETIVSVYQGNTCQRDSKGKWPMSAA